MQSLSQQQRLNLKLSPQQIQLMKLIEVPTLHLEERILEELNENPALELKDSLRSAAIFRKLPLLEKRVHDLEKQINEDKQ